jgi:sensor histidine kinase YesM
MDNLCRERFYQFDARTVLVGLLYYTIVIDTFIALFLTLTGIFPGAVTLKTFVINLLISQGYGISTWAIIVLLFWAYKPKKEASHAFIVLIGSACGIFLGSLMRNFILQQIFPTHIWEWQKTFLKTVVVCFASAGVICYFLYTKRRFKVGKEIMQQERINRLSSEKQALEANLRLLQAQIEPHFLFNTLSNILSLLDTDLKKGQSMLMDLIRYLRTSLSKTREDTTTLGQEMEMLQTYLDIFKIRMEDRLLYRIEVPKSIKDFPFPPLLIQPLVENAIRHGIEPKVEGGTITIRARKNGNVLRVEITDTGAGLPEDGNLGFGLSNVRERLKSLYGDSGRLILEENRPSGLKAIIEVPYVPN